MKGYSQLEVLLTILIVGIMSVFVTLSYNNYSDRAKGQEAANTASEIRQLVLLWAVCMGQIYYDDCIVLAPAYVGDPREIEFLYGIDNKIEIVPNPAPADLCYPVTSSFEILITSDDCDSADIPKILNKSRYTPAPLNLNGAGHFFYI